MKIIPAQRQQPFPNPAASRERTLCSWGRADRGGCSHPGQEGGPLLVLAAGQRGQAGGPGLGLAFSSAVVHTPPR